MIRCLECGKKMRQITWKHLAHHSMTPLEYKFKHKLKQSETLCEETRALKIASQSKCGEFLKGSRSTGEAISLGMKKKFRHFWGDKISASTKGYVKSPTHRENISIARTRFCKQFRKLDDNEIEWIRRMYVPMKHTGFSMNGLAHRFNVSPSTVYAVIHRSNGYRHQLEAK